MTGTTSSPEALAERAVEETLATCGGLQPPMDRIAAQTLIGLLRDGDHDSGERQRAWDRLHELLIARGGETRPTTAPQQPAAGAPAAAPAQARLLPDPDRIVADALHTTLDGTAERFAYLAGVAEARLLEQLDAVTATPAEGDAALARLRRRLAEERSRCVWRSADDGG